MTDNSELQRLTRLRRLSRQIAASLPGDLDLEQVFQVQGHVRELPAERQTPEDADVEQGSTSSGAGDGRLANYRGPVTLCPPAAPPKPDRSDDLELV